MKINISVFYSKKAFVEFNKIFLKFHERKKFILLLLFPTLFLIISLIFLFLADYLAAIFIAIHAIISLILIIVYQKDKLKSATYNPDNRFLFTQYELIMTEKFISTHSKYGFTKIELNYLSKIVITKNYLVFYNHALPLLLLEKNELDVVDRNEIMAIISHHYQGEVIKIDD